MSGVIAKFKITSVEATEWNTIVKAAPVHPQNDDQAHPQNQDENRRFWEASPSGSLELTITNPPAAEQFQPGDEWYLNFTRAEKPDAS